MMNPRNRSLVSVLLLLTALMAAVSLGMVWTTQAADTKLNGPMQPGGDVFDFRISPDGQYVVYRADQDTDAAIQLYSVPISGGDPVRLSGLLPSGTSVGDDYQISPDSSRVVYRAPQETVGVDELYSVPITGPASAAVKLNKTLVSGGAVAPGFQISPDGTRVVYRSDQEQNDLTELFSVPIAGPASSGVKLNQSLTSGGRVASDFLISPDSSWVVYRAQQDTQDMEELYSVPITGPASAGIKLNGVMIGEGDVASNFAISPDSQWVVYRADQQTDEMVEIYSVAIDGSSLEKLNQVMVAEGDVSSDFLISPDSQWVVYRADQQFDTITELYSVPINGPSSAGVKINGLLALGGDVSSGFLISPDSQWVVYRADQNSVGVIEIFSVPIRGPSSANIQLNRSLPAGGDVSSDFSISPDSQWVVYRADQDSDNVTELYSVPLTGPSSAGVKLNLPLPQGGNVSSGFIITADSGRVVYRADQRTDNNVELFSVSIAGPGESGVRISGDLISDGDVLENFAVDDLDTYAVYLADQDTDDLIELYATELQTLVTFTGSSLLVDETMGSVWLTVNKLNAGSALTVTVDVSVAAGTATGGGVDYLLKDTQVMFAADEWSKSVEIEIVDDGQEEPLETVTLKLENPQNAVVGEKPSITLMIVDQLYTVYLPLVMK